MDITPLGLIRNWLPHLPEILLTIVLAILGRRQEGEHQDVLTQIIVACARPVLGTPSAIGRAQRVFRINWPIFGGVWVVKARVEIDRDLTEVDEKGAREGRREGKTSEDERREDGRVMSIRDAVRFAITSLDPNLDSESPSECLCAIPQVLPVEIEYHAHRPNTYPWTRPPALSEREKYQLMMNDLTSTSTPDLNRNKIKDSFSGPTILYLHGGAHCLMSPTSHRLITTRLARESGGRIVSVKYRLSPQNVFPAALIDAFVVYLGLLWPGEGSLHGAVEGGRIVVAGDSSGGGIAAGLMLLLLELGRKAVKVRWQGRDVSIPVPPCAGLAMASPWLDITRCLPSCTENARWDILAPPPVSGSVRSSPDFPEDEVWPSSPPRAETYCDARMCGHPVVSPLAASAELWRGTLAVYVHVGWEGMQDEAEVVARRVHDGGGRVVFEGFEGMPHCFGVMPWNWAGERAMRNWGRFCRLAVHGKNGGERDEMWERMYSDQWKDEATWTSSKTGEARRVKIGDLGMTNVGCGHFRNVSLTDEEVARRMKEGVSWRMRIEEQMFMDWRQKEKLKMINEP